YYVIKDMYKKEVNQRMANIKSAIKRVKTNEKKRASNQTFKSERRTQRKHVGKLIEENDVENAKASLQKTFKKIDKAIQKGVVHANNGNRQKARLTEKVSELGAYIKEKTIRTCWDRFFFIYFELLHVIKVQMPGLFLFFLVSLSHLHSLIDP